MKINEILLKIIETLNITSKKINLKLVFMGGIASNIWATPRATYDVDGLIEYKRDKLSKFLSILKKKGFNYNTRKPIKEIFGMSFITFMVKHDKHKIYVDLFLATNSYQKEVLCRAKKTKFKRQTIPIISAEDLILFKLISGRARDLDDIREIFIQQKNKLDMKYLIRWAKELGVYHFLQDELKKSRIM